METLRACYRFPTLSRIEVMHMIHKGQAGTSDVISEIKLINRLFGVA